MSYTATKAPASPTSWPRRPSVCWRLSLFRPGNLCFTAWNRWQGPFPLENCRLALNLCPGTGVWVPLRQLFRRSPCPRWSSGRISKHWRQRRCSCHEPIRKSNDFIALSWPIHERHNPHGWSLSGFAMQHTTRIELHIQLYCKHILKLPDID